MAEALGLGADLLADDNAVGDGSAQARAIQIQEIEGDVSGHSQKEPQKQRLPGQ